MTHGKVTGCAVHCTLTDHVMTLFSSSVGRAHFFNVMLVIRAQWVKVSYGAVSMIVLVFLLQKSTPLNKFRLARPGVVCFACPYSR